MDFTTFVISGPSTISTSEYMGIAGIALAKASSTIGKKMNTAGQCRTDTFQVAGGTNTPVLCGTLTGDHCNVHNALFLGQVSAWLSATLLPISCKSAQPVPAWLEEPVSRPVRQSSSSGVTNNPPLFQDALSQHGKVDCVGCPNLCLLPVAYSAADGEHGRATTLTRSHVLLQCTLTMI